MSSGFDLTFSVRVTNRCLGSELTLARR